MNVDHDPGDEQHHEPTKAEIKEWCRLSMMATLRSLCDPLAATFGGPIYLVGSYAGCPEEACDQRARDLDLRCVVSEDQLTETFGVREVSFGATCAADVARWREERKQSRRLSRRLHCRVDFQLQLEVEFTRKKGNRVRIDGIPAHVFGAGDGEP